MRWAADEINNAGGVLGRKIEVVTRDTQGDPTKAVNAVQELINRVKTETVDKKLQTRIDWVIEAMTRADREAALRWLDRAIEYIANRTNGRC